MLSRLLEESRAAGDAAGTLVTESATIRGDAEGGPESLAGAIDALRDALSPAAAFERTSDAVARGNLKVFAEIGLAFARFLALFASGRPDSSTLAAFRDTLRTGNPPDGQEYLRQAFAHYVRAMDAKDEKDCAELLLLANVEIGFHEQTRLQPEILEAMNAPVYDPALLRRRLTEELFPDADSRMRYLAARIAGRAGSLIASRDRLASEVQRLGRETITEFMMTLELPRKRVIGLGKDLQGEFPATLRDLRNPNLRAFLERVDRTADSLATTGARDWSDLLQRMHFIADLFRTHHDDALLFESPFTLEQTTALKAGRRPADI